MSTCHPQLDDQQRNLIPELTTPFLCAWQGCDEARAESEIVEATRYFRHVNNHAEEYRGEKGKAISCLWINASSGQLCSFKVSTVSKLKDHLRSHSQEKLVGCPRSVSKQVRFCSLSSCRSSIPPLHWMNQLEEEDLVLRNLAALDCIRSIPKIR